MNLKDPRRINIPKDILYQKYIVENMSRKDCAIFFNVTEYQIKSKIKNFGLVKSKDKVFETISNSQKIHLDKDKLYDLYVVQNLSQVECAKIFNVQPHIVKKRLHEFGIKKPQDKFKDIHKTHANHTNETIIKRKQTLMDKYGVDNVSKIKNIKDKKTQTCLNKYGVGNGSQKNYSKLFVSLQNDSNASISFFNQNNQKFTIEELGEYLKVSYIPLTDWLDKFNLRKYIKHIPSKTEDSVADYIKSLGIEHIVRRARNILDNGKEIDIYLPDYKIAIEVNGTYWHSEIEKDKKYHLNKSKDCENKGIRLIHIWQYEWDNEIQKEKIKMLLKIALGKVERKIYARNCVIKEISNKEAKALNEKVHLQGHRNAQITYGLFCDNELVQLMSFSKTKYNRNLKNDSSWEIIRGCPGSNNLVVGGVSKLFNHFVKENNPTQIFSYCDFNKFNGRSYEQLGMKFIGYTGPDVKYVLNNGQVVNRNPFKYQYNKKNMKWRLYGAGSKKYVWSC